MAIEPNKNMSKAQLMAAMKAKEGEILQKTEGTPQFFFEEEAMNLPLNAEVGYANPLQMKRVHAILEMCGSGKTIADIGGGDGFIADLLKKQSNAVTIVDASEIRVLRAKYLLDIEAIQHDISKGLPFEDESVDICLLAEVVEHLENPFVLLQEAQRIIKPNGRIIFTVPIHPMHDAYYQHFWAIRQNNIEDNMLVLSFDRILPHIESFRKLNSK